MIFIYFLNNLMYILIQNYSFLNKHYEIYFVIYFVIIYNLLMYLSLNEV